MSTDPYTLFLDRITAIHKHDEREVCLACLTPIPCDTMRAVWILDLSTRPQTAGA